MSEAAKVIPFTVAKKPRSLGGSPVRGIQSLPPGMSVEQCARKALALYASSGVMSTAAAEVGVPVGACRLITKIVLIADRDDLSERDHAIAVAALARMNANNEKIETVYRSVEDLARRIWGTQRSGGKPPRVAEAQRVNRFEHSFGVAVQACSNIAVMDVPHLPPDRARRAMGELRCAIRDLNVLIDKIRRFHQ